ncbi:MAG: ATP-dependent helicase [Acholeplasmatales bacterium]|jgi:ATP-dependent DNA helicase RecQ|nr:ATP-dependent helicase [Acholeplasmatales bacterium]
MKNEVIRIVGLLKQTNILSDSKDFTAYLKSNNPSVPSKSLIFYNNLEKEILDILCLENKEINIKQFYEETKQKDSNTTINDIKLLLNYLKINKMIDYFYSGYSKTTQKNDYITIRSLYQTETLKEKSSKRIDISQKIITYLYSKYQKSTTEEKEEPILFSRVELINNHKNDLFDEDISIEEIDDALFYLLQINALKIEGEFLVIYNRMLLERTADVKDRYKKEHYQHLYNYYQSRTEQIHIVGEYAKKMKESSEAAEAFVYDYFNMESDFFMNKYFHSRKHQLLRNMTEVKYNTLFGNLSEKQREIINDKDDKYIVVLAGPGSGKTMLLTHKLASLYMSEDVKHEQMIMLTFSRAAATEFRIRLRKLIGNSAYYITISTFYSYCFDLQGIIGNLDRTDDIIKTTIEAIKNNSIYQNKIGKLVLVIDEAQDISEEEFDLIKLLMEKNEEMRIIAVGDDDQSIYLFRGASPKYLEELSKFSGAKTFELLTNYRSKSNIVSLSNSFIEQMKGRLKRNKIVPNTVEKGIVKIYKYKSQFICAPAVNSLINNINENSLNGTTAILARTNEEVLQIGALLIKNGISVKYVVGNSKINIYDLAEMRYFYSLLNVTDDTKIIEIEDWNKTKTQLELKYVSSNILNYCLSALNVFEEQSGNILFKNDFLQFLNESKLEDFVYVNGEEVLVSTIHQAKGKEFDNVFIVLSNYYTPLKNEDVRAIYVALTRAKNNLFIYCNTDIFDNFKNDGVQLFYDNTEYEQSSEIVIECGYKSVVLDAFDDFKYEINKLVSGDELIVEDKGCMHNEKSVVKFSSSMRQEIENWKVKGYFPYIAKVNTVVYYKIKHKNNRESKIVLPIVYFRKKDPNAE